MSSRVRLARNIKDAAFPGWAKKPERIRVLELIRPAVESLAGNEGCLFRVDGQSLDARQADPGRAPSHQPRTCRQERGQRTGAEPGRNALRDDQRRRSSADAGAAARVCRLRQAWTAIDQADSALEKKLDYAFSSGTGLSHRVPDEHRHRHSRQRDAALARPGAGRADQSDHSVREQTRTWPFAGFTAKAPKRWAMSFRFPTR